VVIGVLFIFLKSMIESKNTELFCTQFVNGVYLHHFDVFYMERQPQILHSVFTPTWTTIIYNNPV
jgi:hypothetical protein